MRRREENEEEYDIMELLERLESLREEMAELGITSSQELERRIRELHAQLDELEEKTED